MRSNPTLNSALIASTLLISAAALAAPAASPARAAATPVDVVSGASPQGQRHTHGGTAGAMGAPSHAWLKRIGDDIGLTDAQRQTIRGLIDSARPNLDAIRKESFEKLQLLKVTTPDQPQYDRVVADVSKSAGELAARLVSDLSQLRSQVWAVLTDAQKTRLAALEEERRQKMRAKMRDRAR